MRYIRLKTVTTKIVDEIIDKVETIKPILEILRDKEIKCTMQLSDGPKMKTVRIDKIDGDRISIRIINPNSVLKKKSLISEIEYLEVNTSDEVLCRTKSDVSRWMLLDPSSDFPEE